MRRDELADVQWLLIEDLPPGKAGDPGRTAADNRWFVKAVLWIARPGGTCRGRFGPKNSVFQRFNRWCDKGVWQRVLEALHGDAAREHLLLDSTIVRAHQQSAGVKRGPVAKRQAALAGA